MLIPKRENRNNLMYGHYHIFRQYTNTKLPYRIHAEVQHGWTPGPGIYGDLSKMGKKEKLQKYFVWNRDNLTRCKSFGYVNAVAIGAPLLYLITKNVGKINKGSLIALPLHGWEKEPIKNTYKVYSDYLDELEKLKLKFHPITVCLYWMEYEKKEIVNSIKNRGFKVITLGHRDNNPNFLTNFQKVVSRYEYVTSNSFGTAIFYALYLKKKVFITGPQFELGYINYQEHLKYKRLRLSYFETTEFYRNRYPQLLWENFDDQPHGEIAELELGVEFKKSPRELRRLFGWQPRLFLCYFVVEIVKNNLRFLRILLSKIKPLRYVYRKIKYCWYIKLYKR